MLSELLEGQLRAGRLLPRSRAPSSLRAAEQLLEICMCRLLVRRVCGLELDSSADAIAREAAEAVDMFLHGYGSRPRRAR
jgi:hypothetical protein